MSQPIIVTLPHRLGKAEALRRLQASFSNAQSSGAGLFVFKNQWLGDHLDFHASLLGQSTTGTVDVAEDHVRLEVQLPWLLSMLANKGLSREAGQAHAGEAGQAFQYAKLTRC
jgi:hypothetical protein